jgi:hypothetical protein
MSSKLALACVSGLLISGFAVAVVGQDPKPAAPVEKPAAKKAGGPGAGFPDLVKGLKETPGCLGVETAKTTSGKSVIFAWFKDKGAAVAWYKSPMHRGLMGMMKGAVTPTSTPLKDVKDDGRPVLVIASITFADKPMIEGIPIPISQIAIETYQPVGDGFAFGGRFSPESMVVPPTKDEAPKN